MTRAHGTKTTPHEWVCPACGHTAPLSTDDYAPATELHRCRRWYCRLTWKAPAAVTAPACPRCYTRLR